MKNSFEQEVIESTRAHINYHQDQINTAHEKETPFKEIASILDGEGESLRERAELGWDTFSFETASPEESLRLIKRFLEIFPQIIKFEKEFDACSREQPRWKWFASFAQRNVLISFAVIPATPGENCQPVKLVHNYSVWSCVPK